MKRLIYLLAAMGLLFTAFMLHPHQTVRADVIATPTSKPNGDVGDLIEPGSDVLPDGAPIDQTVKNPQPLIGQIYLLEETFEGYFPEDNGWSVYDCNSGDGLEYFWDDQNYLYWAGYWSAWPANGGANGFDPNASSTYPANMCTWMTKGPFDLRGVYSGKLFLKYWSKTEANYDFFKWMVSVDGSNYSGYITSGDSGGWQTKEIDLASVPTLGNVLGDSSVWVGLKFTSDGSNQYSGAFVDNVYLEVYKTCYPLQLEYLGSGSDLVADPSSSGTCTTGNYYTGEVITLTASPAAGWVVSDWDGTDNDSSTGLTNTVTMPAQHHIVTVYYSQQVQSSTFKSDGGLDGWILESGENSGKGGTMNSTATVFYVGDNAQKKQYRSILSFDTSALPETATITQVTLKLKLQGTVGTSPLTTHGNLVVDIKKGSFGISSILNIADFQAAASKNAVGTIPKTPVSGWYTKTWTSGIFTYISTNGWTQFRLRFATDDDNDSVADYLKFYSGNAGTASYRPQLIIEYYVP